MNKNTDFKNNFSAKILEAYKDNEFLNAAKFDVSSCNVKRLFWTTLTYSSKNKTEEDAKSDLVKFGNYISRKLESEVELFASFANWDTRPHIHLIFHSNTSLEKEDTKKAIRNAWKHSSDVSIDDYKDHLFNENIHYLYTKHAPIRTTTFFHNRASKKQFQSNRRRRV